MQKALVLVPLLVLGWTWTIQGLPLAVEPLYPTQENFDLTRFLGTWHDVAEATTCPHIHRHRSNAAIGKLVLQRGADEGKLQMIRTKLKRGVCMESSGEYNLTATPGRFNYYVAKWDADVDAYVVHTNYEEYAIVMTVKEKPAGHSSTSVKLYSRSLDVRDTVMEDFKTLAREQGMSDDNIIIRSNKGDCTPGEHLEEVTFDLDLQLQRSRRQVAPVMDLADMDGSGSDLLTFNDSESCQLKAETGPCFGIHQRFFYNSSSLTCQPFKYGGCLGNDNNFKTEKECLQRCRVAAVCRLPLAVEKCTGQPLTWSFDSNLGVCFPYKAGYCQLNGNKFYSKAECQEYCQAKDEDTTAVVPLAQTMPEE
ncbi:protein AMBP [Nerophis lumbriciformis]|uniref:protein AMBP n=1 Tax=Nerophis lumbriciformis TaxID=546530 RepID=UPI002AE03948|nr:protein AMBP-like [Nerophis lumbriciformis]XP_061822053.1 protein AMBP-like [Nerophis lumbriciformis]